VVILQVVAKHENANSREYLDSLVENMHRILKMLDPAPSVQFQVQVLSRRSKIGGGGGYLVSRYFIPFPGRYVLLPSSGDQDLHVGPDEGVSSICTPIFSEKYWDFK
jgi:hypothetical protein